MESSAKAPTNRSIGWADDIADQQPTPRSATSSGAHLTDSSPAIPWTRTWIEASWLSGERTRRRVNLVMAVVGLVLAAPVMVVIAILVKATSRGPILYTQSRVGHDRRALLRKFRRGDGARGVDHADSDGPCRRQEDRGGRLFTIYKFRTMYCDDGRDQVWACPDDDRVTPVGRVLRALHLDELPQLVNVLKGDMNVVGPRPEQPKIFARLARALPEYRFRQMVRPGITGWAQVNHHYDRSMDDVRKKVELDLEYIERRSALEDVKIAFQTLPAVFTEDGKGRGW